MHEGDENSRLIETIRRMGWRRGSVIPGNLADVIFRDPIVRPADPDETQFLVLSHDCDLVHHDLIAEPTIEIISFKSVASVDGYCLHGKNPRRLHLSDPLDSQYFEFQAKSRRFCDRRLLAVAPPETATTFSDDQIRCLVDWIARRYLRTAFPDAFNDRLKPAASKLNKLLKSGGKQITSIFVEMEMRELGDDETYNLILYALMRSPDFADSLQKIAITEVLSQMESIINSNCKGVEVKESILQSEEEMSVAQIRLISRLEFDHLSHGENNATPSPRI